MPYFMIERDIPGAGRMSPDELQAAIRASNDALDDLGPDIQWLHSFVTDDKVYCIYMSPDESLIRQHSSQSGIPADRIAAVRAMLMGDGVHAAEEVLADS